MPAAAYLLRAPLPTGRLLLNIVLNLSAFLLSGALAAFLAEQLQGARTELREREKRLSALEATFSAVVHSISSGIVTVDEDGLITYLNPAGEEIFGMSDTELRGAPLRARLPALAPALDAPLPAGRQRNEALVVGPDGRQHTVGWAVGRLNEHGAAGWVIVFQDLTEFRRMEEAMRRSDRLAVVGGLAAGLAHEIRNPLAAMTGSIELIGGAPGLLESERQLLQIVRSEGQRLEALVRDFLSFAKPASPQLGIVDGHALVVETAELFRAEAERRGVTLSVDAEADVGLRADGPQIKQVLWNLLGNAADATPGVGRSRSRSGGRASRRSSASPTRGRASRERTCPASSIPSSPPRSGGRVSASPSCTAWSKRTAAASACRANAAVAARSPCRFPRQRLRDSASPRGRLGLHGPGSGGR